MAVRRETAAGDDTMQVRVMGELLAPGVEDGEEADLGAEMTAKVAANAANAERILIRSDRKSVV